MSDGDWYCLCTLIIVRPSFQLGEHLTSNVAHFLFSSLEAIEDESFHFDSNITDARSDVSKQSVVNPLGKLSLPTLSSLPTLGAPNTTMAGIMPSSSSLSKQKFEALKPMREATQARRSSTLCTPDSSIREARRTSVLCTSFPPADTLGKVIDVRNTTSSTSVEQSVVSKGRRFSQAMVNHIVASTPPSSIPHTPVQSHASLAGHASPSQTHLSHRLSESRRSSQSTDVMETMFSALDSSFIASNLSVNLTQAPLSCTSTMAPQPVKHQLNALSITLTSINASPFRAAPSISARAPSTISVIAPQSDKPSIFIVIRLLLS